METTGEDEDLTSTEGVNEGSAASTVERSGGASGGASGGGPGGAPAVTRALPGVLGPAGSPSEPGPAAPVPPSDQPAGPGQQLAAGEG